MFRQFKGYTCEGLEILPASAGLLQRARVYSRERSEEVKITVHSESEIAAAAKTLLDAFPATRTFAFHGEMGAGKTTFIKAICSELGVRDGMSSPTFSLVNEYITDMGETIFHFDFYRIGNENDAYQAGLHEYFDTGNYCFVEWPEKVPSILPTGTIHIHIVTEGNSRLVTAS